MNKRITEISGLSSLVKDYNTFLVDLWGVIHNGINIFPGIIELLKRLKEEDKQVIFVTNAPRRSEVIRLQLQDFGISSNLFSFVISSGEISWLRMNEIIKHKKLNNCFHIGPPRDDHLTEELKIKIVNEPKYTDFILNTGPWGENDSLDNYKEILFELSKTKPLMICANPDKKVIRGEKFMICAGLLAEYYEKLGGNVEYLGKPYPEIYEKCFELSSEQNKTKFLIIGDSLDNDIKGALNNKIDSLLVTSGIHRKVNNNKNIDIEKLHDLMMKKNIFSKFVIEKLTW